MDIKKLREKYLSKYDELMEQLTELTPVQCYKRDLICVQLNEIRLLIQQLSVMEERE